LEVFEAIMNRRSVRAFLEKDITDETIEKLIDAARHAPSAGNIQPWEFIIVRKTEQKRKLVEAALNQTFIEEAPVVIVVCANQALSEMGYGSRGLNLYCIQDTAAATQNLLLAAFSLGLGTCWVGAFHEKKVAETLNLPEKVRPVAIIPVGHPAEKPRTPKKRLLHQIIHYEKYGGKIRIET
jgi:nitroreductase